jgi:hypothetical protein
MPCYDSRDNDCSYDRDRANVNARVACDAITVLEKYGIAHRLTAESAAWWKEHKAADLKRQNDEA